MQDLKKILMIDDDPILVHNLAKLLSKRGFEVFAVPSPKEAIKVMEENSIDACITDLAMPNGTGVEFLSTIRKDARWNKLPVIVNSGFGEKMFKEVSAYWPVRVFQKPVHIKELVETLSNVFN